MMGTGNNRFGVKLSEKTKTKMSLAQRGEKGNGWKGDMTKPSAMHIWVESILGKPRKCEHCGSTTAKKYEWSNKEHTYLRKLEDYQRLCTRCHRLWDIENNCFDNLKNKKKE